MGIPTTHLQEGAKTSWVKRGSCASLPATIEGFGSIKPSATNPPILELIDYEPDPVTNAAKCVYRMAEEDSDFGKKLATSIRITEDVIKQYG